MKLAVRVDLSRTGKPDIPLIRNAEALGFHSAWTGETWGYDALSPLAYIAGQTDRIKLGTAIVNVSARTPALLAMNAQTLNALAGGDRVLLGIGTSGPQVVEGWHGRPWGKPNYRLRDTVAIMRKVWAGEPLEYQGKEIQLPYQGEGGVGLGKPLRNGIRNVQPVPILIGAETPLNIRMTGEVADGLITMHAVPRTVGAAVTLLGEGLARRSDGRTMDMLEITGDVRAAVNDDVAGTIRKAKRAVALLVGGYGAKSMNFHKNAFASRGFADEADRIQELYLAGHHDEAAEAVPDEYVDEGMLIGPLDRIRERWRAWRDSKFTIVSIHTHRSDVLEIIARETDR